MIQNCFGLGFAIANRKSMYTRTFVFLLPFLSYFINWGNTYMTSDNTVPSIRFKLNTVCILRA